MVANEGDETKVKVKFLSDQVYETEGRGQGRKFTAGRVYTLTDNLAQRWIRRDVAVLVEEATEADGDEPPKPRRGRPPKAKTAENGDEVEDDDGEDDEPEPAPKPPEPPKAPPEPEPPKDPGPAPVPTPASPARHPFKGR